MAATTEEVPRPYGRGTSSVVSFVVAIVAMNRVDVVDLVVDLVDVDLDVDLVDVDLDVAVSNFQIFDFSKTFKSSLDAFGRLYSPE